MHTRKNSGNIAPSGGAPQVVVQRVGGAATPSDAITHPTWIMKARAGGPPVERGPDPARCIMFQLDRNDTPTQGYLRYANRTLDQVSEYTPMRGIPLATHGRHIPRCGERTSPCVHRPRSPSVPALPCLTNTPWWRGSPETVALLFERPRRSLSFSTPSQ